MLVIIAFMILTCAIAVFFSDEIITSIKAILAIPGASITIPVVLVTMFLFKSQDWLLILLHLCNYFFQRVYYGFASFISNKSWVLVLSKIFSVWLFALLPLWIAEACARRKRFETYHHKLFLGMMVWLFWSILFILTQG